jgi:hypothetical protein
MTKINAQTQFGMRHTVFRQVDETVALLTAPSQSKQPPDMGERLAIKAWLYGAHFLAASSVVGALLGLGGLILKGVFVLLGIGAESHDMTTHETVPGNPLLLHIHHLFFNVGFVFYFISIVSTIFKKIRTGNQP